jgi:hypothetical protein
MERHFLVRFVYRIRTNKAKSHKNSNQYFVLDASHKTCPNGLAEDFTSLMYAGKDAILSYDQNRQP